MNSIMTEKLSIAEHTKLLTSLLLRKIQAFNDFYSATLILGQNIQEKNVLNIEAMINLREKQIADIDMINEQINEISGGSLPKNIIIDDLNNTLRNVIKKIQEYDNKHLALAIKLLKENGDDLLLLRKEINALKAYREKQP